MGQVRQLPTVLVLAVVVAGLAVGAFAGWRTGALLLSAGPLLGGALRLSLSDGQAGWLAVRSRGLDATVLLGLGFALAALARTIPDV